MIHSVDEIIAYVSNFFSLRIGDYIFTGTPAGVGPVNHGDILQGNIEDKEILNFRILG
jgi:2-keto-4-pentenoate hydratase/2-oxohepta-3-ene-1,7-dioic acid hydratase in catechol pathway